MKKIFLTASAIGLVLSGGNAQAEDSMADRINKLEKEIQLLKKQQEVSNKKPTSIEKVFDKKEKLAVNNEKSASVELGKKGLSITSPDKKYNLELHGAFQLDNRSFISTNNTTTGRSENLVRRAKPTLNLKVGDALFSFTPDFAGTSTTANNTKTSDAYAEYKFSNAAKVTAGKFKPPVGLEQLQSDSDNMFVERGYAASLAPSRDIGVQVAGEILPETLEYQLGVFNGVADLASTDGDNDNKKDLAARLFAKPFSNSDTVSLREFGFGIGGSVGDRKGSTSNRILPTYSSLGQQTFFTYASTAYANGTQWRFSPQAYWYSGNKGVLAEYAVSNQDVSSGSTSLELQNTAWNISASYVITGEDAKFKGSVKPVSDFNPANGTWGAWEVVARITALAIDKAAFPVLASSLTSASKAQSYGAGLNWYLNENIKIATNYSYTQFDGGATGGRDKPEEQVIQSRLQFRF